jgi:cytochrome c553
MKKFIAAVALTMFAATSLFAADEIILNAKNGNVKFNHKKHQELNKDCKTCHEKDAGGKIAGFAKDSAHKQCKGCHETKKAGPTKCGECHKK